MQDEGENSFSRLQVFQGKAGNSASEPMQPGAASGLGPLFTVLFVASGRWIKYSYES